MRSLKRYDPAPSPLIYRVERFWVKRSTRRFVLIWMPLLFSAALGLALLLHPSQQARSLALFESMYRSVVEHPGVRLTAVRIEGAVPDTREQVERIMSDILPASALTLNLEAVRNRLEALPPVESAQLEVAGGGLLQVVLSERVPVALLRRGERLTLIDLEGVMIRTVSARSAYPELPLLLGEGAEHVAAEALMLISIAAPLEERLQAVARVGERRWTIHLDRNQTIALPAQEPESALRHVVALHRASDLLERDIAVVDMRIPGRPVIRLTDNATLQIRQSRDFRP